MMAMYAMTSASVTCSQPLVPNFGPNTEETCGSHQDMCAYDRGTNFIHKIINTMSFIKQAL